MAAKVEPDEKAMARVLRAFIHSCDEDDLDWCYAHHALDGVPSRATRATIRALRAQSLLELCRGGTNEDGEIVGGSGYRATYKGRLWLKGIENQQELPL